MTYVFYELEKKLGPFASQLKESVFHDVLMLPPQSIPLCSLFP